MYLRVFVKKTPALQATIYLVQEDLLQAELLPRKTVEQLQHLSYQELWTEGTIYYESCM